MKYPQDPLTTGKDQPQPGQSRHVNVRSDIFPKLVGLQKSLEAHGFAVLKIAGSGLPGKRKLVAQFDNWSMMVPTSLDAFLATYGDVLLSHLDSSLLPLAWRVASDSTVEDTSDLSTFVMQLQPRVLPYSGLAFPVRLGASGNGYVLFAINGSVELAGDRIIDIHSRCCKVMTDLLSLDERRTQPAETLSDREIACLQLAGDGRISEEIAGTLGLSVHTVNAYLGSATIKLDSVNRIQAIAKAIRLGYIN